MMAGFFEDLEEWKKYWKGMPEFVQYDESPYKSIIVHFNDEGDVENFSKLTGQKITSKTKFINFPKIERENLLAKVCQGVGNPKYPVYIPSKGRWQSRLTSKALEKLNVPYYIVVEPSEYRNYRRVIDKSKILVLPENDMKLIGSRCWIMEHFIQNGFERHWQLDDNITDFYRLNRNIKYRVDSGLIFSIIEEWCDRYTNIAIAGMQYEMFVPRKTITPPIIINTRVYSCSLVNNSIPYRWRSVYNDDTDICLCALKDGWCTALFQAFLCDKKATMTLKGGNTESLYTIKDGRLKMAEALQELHPDVTKITTKWNRPQHQVDYSQFKKHYSSKPKLKKGIVLTEETNDFGMKLKNKEI